MKKLVTKIRVRWQETDASGAVHFTSFLRYMEVGETELFRSLGVTQREWMEREKMGMPRVEVHCRYRRPVLYDEELFIRSWAEITGKALIIHNEILKKGERRPIAQGYIKCLCVELRNGRYYRARSVPGALVNYLGPYLVRRE